MVFGRAALRGAIPLTQALRLYKAGIGLRNCHAGREKAWRQKAAAFPLWYSVLLQRL